ncbi:translationally-controlled tumor protein [uncultured Methanobrevibacter sp.]|uniref:translationally-controlled tumor protein n=1 Tax=uncultured Methanobrevibacter sp. TaxID=253161 RepID=UPI00261291D3
MRIFKDVLTGDEMTSDTFEMTSEYEDAILKIPSKNRPKDDLGDVDIGCGNAFGQPEEAPEEAPAQGNVEMVLDVVANHDLKQVNMSKKEFMAYIKDYFKKIIAYLEENGKKDRVEGFKKGAQAFIKFIVPKYDDIELYTGANGENDEGEIVGSVAISYWEDDTAKGPMFYFFKDGLKDEAV